MVCVALRKESVDRNISPPPQIKPVRGSLSARRAWIEISKLQRSIDIISVALRKESVDRNEQLALKTMKNTDVALRKESVDRNTIISQTVSEIIGSLSARRAWIEIRRAIRPATGRPVALRKESVDRNPLFVCPSVRK